MTSSPIKNLVEISSSAAGPEISAASFPLVVKHTGVSIPAQLATLLSLKNGFQAFGGALCTFPFGSDSATEISRWNRLDGWRGSYCDVIKPDAIAFAFDLFANEYIIDAEGVWKLNAETGEVDSKGRTLDDWAEIVLNDYSYETGYPLAAEWQKQNHSLNSASRLLPRMPFVLGGDYVPSNLKEVRSDLASKKLGQLYLEISNLPDGAEVSLSGWI